LTAAYFLRQLAYHSLGIYRIAIILVCSEEAGMTILGFATGMEAM
jgi:hypothetical protein